MTMASEPPGLPVPVHWTADGLAVSLLDQTLLPDEERYLRLETVEEVAEAIASLRVRGAPAIGIAAAMGLAMGGRRRLEGDGPGIPRESRRERNQPRPDGEPAPVGTPGMPAGDLEAGFRTDRDLLLATRPTAVNLSWAMERMTGVFATAGRQGERARVEALLREAGAIAREDRDMCRRIGEHGLEVIPEEGATILTHCNAGALATGGMGTALAPVYAAHALGLPVEVFADETRPLLQGARITAWELRRAGVPVTIITDSMAAALMKEGRVNLVLVGADRVAANGDVANKIGTYGLAVLARHHGIPFYVALPRTTFDPSLQGGGAIPIEARDSSEVLGMAGRRIAPEGAKAWNPAFDVTPAHLVTAFITDEGILRPPYRASIARVLAGTAWAAEPPPGPDPAPNGGSLPPAPEEVP